MSTDYRRGYKAGFKARKTESARKARTKEIIAYKAKVVVPEAKVDGAPSAQVIRVYRHILERLERGQTTGKTNHHAYGPAKVAQALPPLIEPQVRDFLEHCRQQGWLRYASHPKGWRRGETSPLPETSY